jgi:hypothetical protein
LEGGRHLVAFEDMRFETVDSVGEHRHPPLMGYVVLDPQLHVEDMFTGRLPQAGPDRK